MKQLTYPTWFAGTPSATTTDAPGGVCGNYVGIAIGPDSEVGIVKVNGDYTLQAGRVLSVAGSTYKLEQYHPKIQSSTTGLVSNGIGLEVILFESYDEMHGSGLQRTNQRYSTGTINAQPPAAQPATPQLAIPFTARQMAQFVVNLGTLAGASCSCVVMGVRWSDVLQAVQRVTLESTTIDSDANGTAGFYLEDENWDALEVYLFNYLGNGGSFSIDAVAIGELQL